jgi:hypothetical protein
MGDTAAERTDSTNGVVAYPAGRAFENRETRKQIRVLHYLEPAMRCESPDLQTFLIIKLYVLQIGYPGNIN